MPPLSPTTTISAQRGQGKVCPPPFCPPPPLFMHKQDANMGLCRTSPTPFVPAPPFTQTGVHRMGHAPLSPATPHFCTKGARERYIHPPFALPPPSFMCKQDTNVGPCGTPPLPPLCPHANGGGAGRGNPLCRDGQGAPASA